MSYFNTVYSNTNAMSQQQPQQGQQQNLSPLPSFLTNVYNNTNAMQVQHTQQQDEASIAAAKIIGDIAEEIENRNFLNLIRSEGQLLIRLNFSEFVNLKKPCQEIIKVNNTHSSSREKIITCFVREFGPLSHVSRKNCDDEIIVLEATITDCRQKYSLGIGGEITSSTDSVHEIHSLAITPSQDLLQQAELSYLTNEFVNIQPALNELDKELTNLGKENGLIPLFLIHGEDFKKNNGLHVLLRIRVNSPPDNQNTLNQGIRPIRINIESQLPLAAIPSFYDEVAKRLGNVEILYKGEEYVGGHKWGSMKKILCPTVQNIFKHENHGFCIEALIPKPGFDRNAIQVYQTVDNSPSIAFK